jgi:hypothetical protein
VRRLDRCGSGREDGYQRLIDAPLRLRAQPGREITKPSGIRARSCSTQDAGDLAKELNGTRMARLAINIDGYGSLLPCGRLLTWGYTSERAKGIEPS